MWLVLWSGIGISLIFYVLTQELPNQETKVGIIVLLGFWLYYEYKMIRTYRWLKYGKEKLSIDEETCTYVPLVGMRGIPISCNLEDMGEISGRTPDEKSLQYQIENSFWVIGTGRLFFNTVTQKCILERNYPKQKPKSWQWC